MLIVGRFWLAVKMTVEEIMMGVADNTSSGL